MAVFTQPKVLALKFSHSFISSSLEFTFKTLFAAEYLRKQLDATAIEPVSPQISGGSKVVKASPARFGSFGWRNR
ncbi:hypothetical protein O9992_15030 [Vibrio lentus]|nr:hypothetical protein [Vibrio lentus]